MEAQMVNHTPYALETILLQYPTSLTIAFTSIYHNLLRDKYTWLTISGTVLQELMVDPSTPKTKLTSIKPEYTRKSYDTKKLTEEIKYLQEKK